jgi:hypothetical protein
VTISAAAIGPLAWLSRGCPLVGPVMEGQQGGYLWVDYDYDIATTTTVATIGTTEGLEFFSVHACTAMPTIASTGVDNDFIDKSCHTDILTNRRTSMSRFSPQGRCSRHDGREQFRTERGPH